MRGLGRLNLARSAAARGAAGKRKQSDVAGALDGYTEPALMTSANTGHAARKNFAALLHELGKNVGALVVDEIHFFDAELTDLFLAEELALAAARSSGTTARASGTARTTFAARTATAETTFATTTARSTVATVPAVAATGTARTTFTARRRSRGRCLRSRWYWILFVRHNFYPFFLCAV